MMKVVSPSLLSARIVPPCAWTISRANGWILRYPAGKEDITGIDNEPWHFRYVGPDAARIMHEYGLCLEEYLGL